MTGSQSVYPNAINRLRALTVPGKWFVRFKITVTMKLLTFKTHRNANIQAKLFQQFIANNPAVEIEFEAEPEDLSPEDIMDNERDIKEIQRQYNQGNGYAWFSARVTVRYKGHEATDYLGCCSYKSEKDFKDNSGYYIDMISQCIERINSDITACNDAICIAFKTRQLKRMADSLGFIVIPKTALV